MSVESATDFMKRLGEDPQFAGDLADKFLAIEKSAQEQVLAEVKAAGYDFTSEELAQAQQSQIERAAILARIFLDTNFGILARAGIMGRVNVYAKPWPYGAMMLDGLMRAGG